MPDAIAVTGGTGFIGSNLVRRLRAGGHPVRLLVRPGGDPEVVVTGVTPVPGDIRDAAAVRRLAGGAVTIYHLAGCARAWSRDPAEFHEVNVRGTRNVLDAARAAGAGRVVHVSTALVTGGEDQLLTEYQRTKRAAERVVGEYVSDGLDAVIVRPTRVYGPGPLTQSNSVTRAIDLYRRGILRVRLDDDDAVANYVYVDDVVEGMLLAGTRGAAGGRYTLDGENATFLRLLATVADVAGRHRRTVVLPEAAARGVAVVSEWLGRLGFEPLITRDWLELLQRDWPVPPDPAIRALGYTPRPLADGVRRTVHWLAAGKPAARAA